MYLYLKYIPAEIDHKLYVVAKKGVAVDPVEMVTMVLISVARPENMCSRLSESKRPRTYRISQGFRSSALGGESEVCR